jgi:diacylglycerol kinase family enzyme
MKKVGVIVNVSAGAAEGGRMIDAIKALFERHGVRPFIEIVQGRRLRDVARRMRSERFDLVVAAGGDGTVSAVASALTGSETALGVLPIGTLNHFARDIGMPLDSEEAVAAICSGEVRSVDAASVNDQVFINNSSLGLYPDQARLRQKWRGKIGRWPALILASIIVLTRFPFLRIVARFNGKTVSRRCPMVLVSNNRYRLEPGRLAERERMDEEVLGIYLLNDEGRTGLLRIAMHSLIYSPEEASSFESDAAREVIVHTRRRRVRVAVDGEVFKFRSPLLFKSLPGALLVIGGQGSGGRASGI